jgi:hypothetical protein
MVNLLNVWNVTTALRKKIGGYIKVTFIYFNVNIFYFVFGYARQI